MEEYMIVYMVSVANDAPKLVGLVMNGSSCSVSSNPKDFKRYDSYSQAQQVVANIHNGVVSPINASRDVSYNVVSINHI